MNSDQISTYTAISLLVTTMMGTGITFMPYAFNSIGYHSSWVILTWVSISTFISLLCISYVVKNKEDRKHTYTSLAKDVSNYEYYFVNISIFFNCFFSNVSFYRFLTDILVESLPFYLGSTLENSRKIVTVLISPILLYLCLKKQLVNLKFQSWISTCSVSFLAFLVVFYSLAFGSKIYNSVPQAFNTNFKYGIPFFIPTMVCEPSMVEVVQKLKIKTWKNIVFISASASISGLLIYGIVGHCGYIVFGNKIQGHIVKEFYDSNSLINMYIKKETIDIFNLTSKLAVFSMIFVLGSGFPIQMIPVSEMFMQFIYKENKNDKRKTVITVCLFAACFALVLIENLRIKLIKRISGAIFSTSVGLIHPFIFYLRIVGNKKLASIIPSTICGITIMIVGYIIMTIIWDVIRADPELYN